MDKEDHDLVAVLEGIQVSAASCEIIAERVDGVESNDRITERVLASIRKAEFVIVDLTKVRPNVFFEVGYAQGW
jgi:nucleoside 2-deoxyribosyltransferase